MNCMKSFCTFALCRLAAVLLAFFSAAGAGADDLYVSVNSRALFRVNTETLTPIPIGAPSLRLSDIAFDDTDTLLGINDGEVLVQLDLNTGRDTVVRSISGIDIGAGSALAFEPTAGRYYVTSFGSGPGANRLSTISSSNGNAVVIGDLPESVEISGLHFDQLGSLWGIDGINDELVRIDRNTATRTVVSPNGLADFPRLSALTIGPTGSFWSINLDESNNTYQLVNIDPLTGTATSRGVIQGLGPFDRPVTTFNPVAGIAAGPPPVDGIIEPQGVAVTSATVSSGGELVSFFAGGNTYTQGDLIRPQVTEFDAIDFNVNVAVPTGAPVPDFGLRAGLLTDDFQLGSGIVNPAVRADAATLVFNTPLVNGPGPDLVVFEINRSRIERPGELPDPFQIEINGVRGVVGAASWGPALGSIDVDAYRRDGGSPSNLAELENSDFSQPEVVLGMEYFGVAIDLDEFGVAPLAAVETLNFGGVSWDGSFDPVLFMGINSAQIIPEPSSLMLLLTVFGGGLLYRLW